MSNTRKYNNQPRQCHIVEEQIKQNTLFSLLLLDIFPLHFERLILEIDIIFLIRDQCKCCKVSEMICLANHFPIIQNKSRHPNYTPRVGEFVPESALK